MNKFLNEILDKHKPQITEFYLEKEYPLGQLVIIDNENIIKSYNISEDQKKDLFNISEQKGIIEAHDKRHYGGRILIRWEFGQKTWLEHSFLLTKI
jgi:outer membrane protein assembly factor BamD (BamD/ComL family)